MRVSHDSYTATPAPCMHATSDPTMQLAPFGQWQRPAWMHAVWYGCTCSLPHPCMPLLDCQVVHTVAKTSSSMFPHVHGQARKQQYVQYVLFLPFERGFFFALRMLLQLPRCTWAAPAEPRAPLNCRAAATHGRLPMHAAVSHARLKHTHAWVSCGGTERAGSCTLCGRVLVHARAVNERRLQLLLL